MADRIIIFFTGLFIISFITIINPCIVTADSELKWDANTGGIDGYRIYYGTSQGNYPNKIEVGKVTQYSLSEINLSENVTYHFVVRAYNSAGESGNSNEVSYSAGDTTPPLPPQGVTVK